MKAYRVCKKEDNSIIGYATTMDTAKKLLLMEFSSAKVIGESLNTIVLQHPYTVQVYGLTPIDITTEGE